MNIRSNPLMPSLEQRIRDAFVWTLERDENMAPIQAEQVARLLLPIIVPWIRQVEAWLCLEAERAQWTQVSLRRGGRVITADKVRDIVTKNTDYEKLSEALELRIFDHVDWEAVAYEITQHFPPPQAGDPSDT